MLTSTRLSDLMAIGLILSINFLYISICTAQNMDSLKQTAYICPTDTCKAKAFHGIANLYLRHNLDSARHYEQTARIYCQRSNVGKYIINNLFQQVALQGQQKNFPACDSLYTLMDSLITHYNVEKKYKPFYYGSRGVYYQRRKLYDEAASVYLDALNNLDPADKDYYKVKTGIYKNLGIVERKKGFYKKALEYYHEGQLCLEKDPLTLKERFSIFTGLGFLYKFIGDYENGIYYYQMAADNIGTLPNNKAIVYRELGELYAIQKNKKLTEAYVDSLARLYDQVTFINKCKLDYSLFVMHMFLDNVDQVDKYMSALEDCNQKNSTRNYIAAKSKYAAYKKDYASAYVYADSFYKSELILDKHRPKIITKILEDVIDAGVKSNVNKKKLDQHFKDYKSLQLELHDFIVADEVEKYSVQFKTRIKQDSIEILQLQTDRQAAVIQNRNNGILFSGLLIISLLGGLRYYFKYSKSQKELNEILAKEKEKLIFENEELIFEKQELSALNDNLKVKVDTLMKQQNVVVPGEKVKIKLKGVNKIHIIDVETIIFISAEKEGCRFYYENGTVWFPEALKNIEAQLPDSLFVQIYRSTIINIMHVKKVNSTNLWMNTGKELKIGRTFKPNIIDKFK